MLSKDQLLQIAERFGTPVYVYDAEKMKEQYQKLKSGFAGLDASFFFACKALTNINVLKYISSLGCGIDCSSINEVKLALHAGVSPENILYTSNGISFEEIQEAVKNGVHVNIDSLSNLEKFGKKFGSSYPVGVRLRPNILAGGNLKISTGHEKSKFGIPVDQLDNLLDVIKQHNIHIKTLHIHTGSDIKDAEVFVHGIKVLTELVAHFPDLEVIDLGGGFKVPYEPDDEETDIAHIAQRLKTYLESHLFNKGKTYTLWFEPGKYLVSECGYLLTQVNVMKDNGAQTFAGINTGLNHLIRPMMYDAYHHIVNLSNAHAEEKVYTVTGYICETDTFATDRLLHEVREGDVLAIYNAGAYGFEMSSNYNSRYKPAEVLVLDGEAKLIRKRDEFEDLLRNQVKAL
ncbi:diaminopimelate decarboxylase [Flavisolibacter ginsenosidimutans]|uniref:Diaminopimelate decarboxylase n=1 Tax=Flavisolibacter ginsenosidimutans TaxID=661481 RepID=A0A5B8UPG7_9BACT|nr:diaminopimelate decarboxylase [Flavisolibacter ginsenosidimutans]QEC58252.1 diaminopimelate decarboxylase [Flavisolibacter ginsenosidimutans]